MASTEKMLALFLVEVKSGEIIPKMVRVLVCKISCKCTYISKVIIIILYIKVCTALDNCRMVVIMASKTYGRETFFSCTTYHEYQLIFHDKKPYFLVKMCDRIDEPNIRTHLESDICYVQRKAGGPMPNDLIDHIIEKLRGLPRGPIQHSLLPLQQLEDQ